MRKREPRRRTGGTALSLAATGGVMALALGGCGQSGPLQLPEKAALAAPEPARRAVPGVARPPVAVRRTGPDRLGRG